MLSVPSDMSGQMTDTMTDIMLGGGPKVLGLPTASSGWATASDGSCGGRSADQPSEFKDGFVHGIFRSVGRLLNLRPRGMSE